ncbi:transposase [Burkholderia dolosa]|uniref:transposase n=1 Tax=Burkholderia dolosa TaxID=152500 RepID=UPI001B95B121|nr:transposase [Burkholderia dolosa]
MCTWVTRRASASTRSGQRAQRRQRQDGHHRSWSGSGRSPRDRNGSFEPILILKHERRFTGFDERIIAMYAGGMSVRESQAFLAEHYGTKVSPDFISLVTNESAFPFSQASSR